MNLEKSKKLFLERLCERPLNDEDRATKLQEIIDHMVTWMDEMREAQKKPIEKRDLVEARQLEDYMDFVTSTLRATVLKRNYTIDDISRIAIREFGEKGLNS